MKNRYLVLLFVLTLLLASSTISLAETPRYGGTVTIAYDQDIASADLHLTTAFPDMEMLLHVMEPLITYDRQINSVGLLAKDWVICDDGLVYTFNLREGVPFHNGDEMTAHDVVYSIQRYIREGAMAGDYALVQEVNYVDRYTMEIILKEPSAVFIQTLASPMAAVVIYPEGEVERQGGTITHPIGTGPFKFVEWVPDRHVIMERFEDYVPDHRPSSGYAGERIAYLDRIIYQVMPEPFQRATALELGTVDVACYLEVLDAITLDGMDHITAKNWPAWNVFDVRVGFKKDLMQDVNMRRAVSHAINRDDMVMATTFGYGAPTASLMIPGTVWDTEAHQYYLEYDPEKAKEYLAKANYQGETIEIIARRAFALEANVATVLQAQLHAVGMRATIRAVEAVAYLDIWANADHHLFVSRASERTDPDGFYGSWYYSHTSPTRYSNEEWDRLVELGRKEMDFDKRMKIYEDLHKLMVEDVPVIPLGYYVNSVGVNNRLKGVDLDWGPGRILYWNVWIEE